MRVHFLGYGGPLTTLKTKPDAEYLGYHYMMAPKTENSVRSDFLKLIKETGAVCSLPFHYTAEEIAPNCFVGVASRLVNGEEYEVMEACLYPPRGRSHWESCRANRLNAPQ